MPAPRRNPDSLLHQEISLPAWAQKETREGRRLRLIVSSAFLILLPVLLLGMVAFALYRLAEAPVATVPVLVDLPPAPTAQDFLTLPLLLGYGSLLALLPIGLRLAGLSWRAQNPGELSRVEARMQAYLAGLGVLYWMLRLFLAPFSAQAENHPLAIFLLSAALSLALHAPLGRALCHFLERLKLGLRRRFPSLVPQKS